jgi:hypothetical protein
MSNGGNAASGTFDDQSGCASSLRRTSICTAQHRSIRSRV